METLPVGKFKAEFSSVLDRVREGESFVISYGRRKKKLAMLVPYKNQRSAEKRPLGIMEGRATYKFRRGFKLSDDKFLAS